MPSRLRVSFAALCAIFAVAMSNVGAQAQEKIKFLLDFAPWGGHAAAHLAVQKGWFKEEGLDVEVLDGRGSVSTIQLVGAGQADVGMAQLGPMATARTTANLPLKSIAGWMRKGDLAVLVDSRANLNTVKDLAGKKLALFAASPFVPFLDMFFKNGGITKEAAQLVYVDPSAMVTAYTSGQADGVMTAGPYGMAIAELVRPTKLILAADYGIAYPSYGLFATESTIAQKKEALRKLVKVQVRAWNYIYDGHVDEGVDAIIKQRPDAKLNPVVLKRHLELYRDFFETPNTKGKTFGWQADADWKEALESMERAGLIKAGWKTSDFFTNDFTPQ